MLTIHNYLAYYQNNIHHSSLRVPIHGISFGSFNNIIKAKNELLSSFLKRRKVKSERLTNLLKMASMVPSSGEHQPQVCWTQSQYSCLCIEGVVVVEIVDQRPNKPSDLFLHCYPVYLMWQPLLALTSYGSWEASCFCLIVYPAKLYLLAFPVFLGLWVYDLCPRVCQVLCIACLHFLSSLNSSDCLPLDKSFRLLCSSIMKREINY